MRAKVVLTGEGYTIKPGIVVYFYLREGAAEDGALWPIPAIIYNVRSPQRIDIAVFGLSGSTLFEDVPFCDQDQAQYRHWTYPPQIVSAQGSSK